MAHGMMNGYLHTMVDQKQDFVTFGKNYARMFGALYFVRDEPGNTEITEESFKPSDWYYDNITKAEQALNCWDALSVEDQAKMLEDEKLNRLAAAKKLLAEVEEERKLILTALGKARLLANSATGDFENYAKDMLRNLEQASTPPTWEAERIAKIEAENSSGELHTRGPKLKIALEEAKLELAKEEKKMGDHKRWYFEIVKRLEVADAGL